MQVFETIDSCREAVRKFKKKDISIGLVPTMGALHEGHLSLVKIAKKHSDAVIVSIFINPTQFNDPKDYDEYQSNLEGDLALLKDLSVDAVFFPSKDMIYPDNFQTWAEVESLSRVHEGEYRPGHFRGVTTIVTILFNVVQPDCAVFGEKDYQQLCIIERMVKDLHFNIDIVRGPLVRDPEGLALSSRNVRLSAEGRSSALMLNKVLRLGIDKYQEGEKNCAVLLKEMRRELETTPGIQSEYLEIVDQESLEPLDQASERARILAAVYVEGVRLIDNMSFR